jgi:hypothetical protein
MLDVLIAEETFCDSLLFLLTDVDICTVLAQLLPKVCEVLEEFVMLSLDVFFCHVTTGSLLHIFFGVTGCLF